MGVRSNSCIFSSVVMGGWGQFAKASPRGGAGTSLNRTGWRADAQARKAGVTIRTRIDRPANHIAGSLLRPAPNRESDPLKLPRPVVYTDIPLTHPGGAGS